MVQIWQLSVARTGDKRAWDNVVLICGSDVRKLPVTKTQSNGLHGVLMAKSHKPRFSLMGKKAVRVCCG